MLLSGKHQSGWRPAGRIAVCIIQATLGIAAAQTLPDAQIDLTLNGKAPRPASGAAAAPSIFYRQQVIIDNLSCGSEINFLSNTIATGDHARNSSTGDAINLSLAKMYWIAGFPLDNGTPRTTLPMAPCQQQVLLRHFLAPQVPGEMLPPAGTDPSPAGIGATLDYAQELDRMDGQANIANLQLNAEFAKVFGASCENVITAVRSNRTVPGQTDYTITYSVGADCVSSEIDTALRKVFVTGQMGSAHVPCGIFGSVSDDAANWDFSMRSLIRVLYLDDLMNARHDLRGGILARDLNTSIRENLIITGINLGPDGYPLTGCGNTENATGSADQRVDDPGFFDQVGQDLGDFFNWLLNHLWVVAPEALAAAGVDPLVSLVLTAGDYAVQNATIPETENHRLMIESTRYLNNELIRRQLASEGDSDRLGNLKSAQQGVHDWLLWDLQRIFTGDFTEYNARPYQREAVGAIMNLYDFAPDAEIRNAAQLVLEYAVARFAIGSSEGRRLVPFRRHMEDVSEHLEAGDRVLFTASEADHQEALGLLYTGQTQQLLPQTVVPYGPPPPAGAPPPAQSPFAPLVLPGEAAFGAFSWYQPSDLVLDLAIDKSVPYFQRFRHAGIEAYSSGKGFLLSAGGILTDYAYNTYGFGDANDRGAGVPSVFMLSGNVDKQRLWDFVSVRGLRESVNGAVNGAQNTYDFNSCVTAGFACGLNLFVPPDIESCLIHGPANREPYWAFLDSANCPGYSNGPPVYAVIYRKPCLLAAPQCETFGFIEAVDIPADSPMAFAQFQANTLSRNPASLVADAPAIVAGGGGSDPSNSSHLRSTYITADGRKIDFDPTAPVLDHNQTGIVAINGAPDTTIDKWQGATGDLVNKTYTLDSFGRIGATVVITNPQPAYKGKSVRLDFSNQLTPSYAYP